MTYSASLNRKNLYCVEYNAVFNMSDNQYI